MSGLGPSAAGQSGPISYFSLKLDHMFVVADAVGDVLGRSDGLFKDDTRILSRFEITIGGVPPALLSSGLSSDNVFFRANLANRPLPQLGETQATPISITHYQDRDGNFLADVSPRRYFCEQCHVVQMQTDPLVKNRFQDVDSIIRKQQKK